MHCSRCTGLGGERFVVTNSPALKLMVEFGCRWSDGARMDRMESWADIHLTDFIARYSVRGLDQVSSPTRWSLLFIGINHSQYT